MNKKSIIGIVLIFAIFVGYMWWIAPSKEELAERQRVNDSIKQAYMDSVAYADSVAAVKAHLDSLAMQGDTSDCQKRVDDGQFLQYGRAGARGGA